MTLLPILAAISGATIIDAVVWVIIAAVVFYLSNWLIAYIGIGEPFLKVAKVVIGVAVFLLLVNALLTIAGHGYISWR